ncbi:LexA family protein [Haemophilus influenzae]|uniref:LexA family protein n=1 Tax=Haemophilus influenzae TaxID=727 RepID=UPI0001A6612C|nr:S24 family peptidase [Haemophilus influenzae]CVQ38037.1 LexA repressor [Streptococcus pneumoniae]MBK1413207.1 helix-turn-helix domain-containing protein [Haemophilus influenzae]MBK1413317.1 helix-turn-helix domain-containing protein [Haemophilus influenzae]MCK8899024.1 helix-turn-helix domain-containing protein [Haemophilus influenzae]MCK8934685.1 helix-turn-helix domain-containing protein [Haemophilus influenzae]
MITEEKIKQNFAARLDIACKRKNLPEKGRGKIIADMLKITPKAVSKWFNAETLPTQANIYVLADFLEVTKEWLTYGDKNASIEKIEKQIYYPLLSPIQAGLWTDIRSLEGFDGYEMIPSTAIASENSFYLRIEGKSMLPRFNEGDLVLIDPDIVPTPGKFVAAINGDNEATFKQYKELGTKTPEGIPHFELVPLNPMFPTLSSLNQEIRIIGVARERVEML